MRPRNFPGRKALRRINARRIEQNRKGLSYTKEDLTRDSKILSEAQQVKTKISRGG